MKVHRKIKICGNIIGVYDYTQGYYKGYSKTRDLIKLDDGNWYKCDSNGELTQQKIGRQLQGTTSQDEYLERRKRTLNKAKNRIKDLVNTNVYQFKDNKGTPIRPKFMTLTFKENHTDIPSANLEFKNFIKRLNYKIKKNDSSFIGLQYVNVIEFQKRGAVHFHTLFFNMPFVHQNDILKLWCKNGGVYISGFKDSVEKKHKLIFDDNGNCVADGHSSIRDVGAYITKTMSYMEKSLDDERLQKKKCYSISSKLKEPTILEDDGVYKEKEVRLFGDTLTSNELCFVNIYANEHIGTCLYREYNTKFSSYQNLEHTNEICYNAFIDEYRKLYNY